jgi:hypothetical protein
MSQIRKPKNEETPLRHYDTKVHKALLFSVINLVKLRDFVPLCLCGEKRLFGVDSKIKLK